MIIAHFAGSGNTRVKYFRHKRINFIVREIHQSHISDDSLEFLITRLIVQIRFDFRSERLNDGLKLAQTGNSHCNGRSEKGC